MRLWGHGASHNCSGRGDGGLGERSVDSTDSNSKNWNLVSSGPVAATTSTPLVVVTLDDDSPFIAYGGEKWGTDHDGESE